MKPLVTTRWPGLLPRLRQASINTLFAQAVASGTVDGEILVDDPGDPRAFYVVHPYGMTLLIGEPDPGFAADLFDHLATPGSRSTGHWLQAYPDGWRPLLTRLCQQASMPTYTRVNFTFDQARYQAERAGRARDGVEVRDVTGDGFGMPGSVVASAFWRDADQFAQLGKAFGVSIDGRLASVAFSSCATEDQLELGIETVGQYRHQGLAWAACAALVDHCLASGLEPVWACRLENTGSYALAQSLGFVDTLHWPYFHFPA